MKLIPLAWVRRLTPALRPLRVAVDGGWLRGSDLDACLGVVHPLLKVQRVMAQVLERRWVADDMLALTLHANGHWQGARPGQHLQLYLEVDGVRLSRSYSLTASNADGRLEIAVQRKDGGRVSALLVERLAVGDTVEIGTVAGALHWPSQAQGVLLLAAGSGITALLGVLREALAQGFSAPVTLLHYVRTPGQRAFVELLEQLQQRYTNVQVHAVFTDPACKAADGTARGRFAAAHLDQLGVTADQVLACGPAGFVERVSAWAQIAGLGEALQFEAFTPPHLPAVQDAHQAVSLRFARSHQQATGDNQRSLLEQAEAEGLRPAFGCRQGICASCTCLLLGGAVRDLRSGAVLREPGQPIRLCVSAPVGDVEIDL
ncbi:MAG: iron-sulfur cluster-binding domain-containing protein [Gammaproteobacteria bacterium]|nr:iron-sulfur cluster-binding domain-containing protein [Gammaproteobacteria bacterium]MBU1491696.1 iron-sulfur cluster-binding domain-containing protein [Gammaproteobacteria bacterium]MBU2216179.1 iron-sulfur cluster-binding domain-containing protein [Gammaproteobacteria bacterium]